MSAPTGRSAQSLQCNLKELFNPHQYRVELTVGLSWIKWIRTLLNLIASKDLGLCLASARHDRLESQRVLSSTHYQSRCRMVFRWCQTANPPDEWVNALTKSWTLSSAYAAATFAWVCPWHTPKLSAASGLTKLPCSGWHHSSLFGIWFESRVSTL